mmetsp:Transcript_120539/g.323618  ORF Transcript_120539/g.323618 Transcript_120539/m.323618 type:complete len:225 (+) Transcript_120539:91-765(+)
MASRPMRLFVSPLMEDTMSPHSVRGTWRSSGQGRAGGLAACRRRWYCSQYSLQKSKMAILSFTTFWNSATRISATWHICRACDVPTWNQWDQRAASDIKLLLSTSWSISSSTCAYAGLCVYLTTPLISMYVASAILPAKKRSSSRMRWSDRMHWFVNSSAKAWYTFNHSINNEWHFMHGANTSNCNFSRKVADRSLKPLTFSFLTMSFVARRARNCLCTSAANV